MINGTIKEPEGIVTFRTRTWIIRFITIPIPIHESRAEQITRKSIFTLTVPFNLIQQLMQAQIYERFTQKFIQLVFHEWGLMRPVFVGSV